MAQTKILIIDDSETSRMIIRRCFHISGWDDAEYLEAEDGLHALHALVESDVNLVVTDLNMPRMDGLTLVKKMRMNPRTKDTPVIVISSMASESLESELKSFGVLRIVHKPVNPEKMTEALEDIHV